LFVCIVSFLNKLLFNLGKKKYKSDWYSISYWTEAILNEECQQL